MMVIVSVLLSVIILFAAITIIAVVNVRAARYNRIYPGDQPAVSQDGVWPPAPLMMPFTEPTPARPSPTLPQREGEE